MSLVLLTTTRDIYTKTIINCNIYNSITQQYLQNETGSHFVLYCINRLFNIFENTWNRDHNDESSVSLSLICFFFVFCFSFIIVIII